MTRRLTNIRGRWAIRVLPSPPFLHLPLLPRRSGLLKAGGGSTWGRGRVASRPQAWILQLKEPVEGWAGGNIARKITGKIVNKPHLLDGEARP